MLLFHNPRLISTAATGSGGDALGGGASVITELTKCGNQIVNIEL